MEIILNKLGHLPTEFFMLSSHEIGVFAVIRADKDIDVSKLLNLAIAEEYSAEEVKLLTVVEGLVGFEYQFAGVPKLETVLRMMILKHTSFH
jgi:hypothetical protein